MSGNVSVLDAPVDVTGIVFWRDGIDWTTKKEDLDHAEEVLIDELAPHVKAFDSYPATPCSRAPTCCPGVERRRPRGRDRGPRALHVGARCAEHRAVGRQLVHPQGRRTSRGRLRLDQLHPRPRDVGHEIDYHGYNTAVKGMQTTCPRTSPTEIIFFTEEEIALRAGEVNSAQDRLDEINNNVKAAAGA